MSGTDTVIDTLDELAKAVAMPAKSAGELIAEASTLHAEAVKYDTAYLDALSKAVPQKDADGDYDGDTVAPETKEGAEEGAECKDAAVQATQAGEIAKAAHGVVNAYFETAEGDDKSEWANFSAKVSKYYGMFNGTLADHVEKWRKAGIDTRAVVAKGDAPKKAKLESAATAFDALVKSADAMAKARADFTSLVQWPRPELKLDPPVRVDFPTDVIEKGWMDIDTKASVMSAMEAYKKVKVTDRPPVYAALMNCAKALNQKLPEGWHAPENLSWNRQETVRTTDISATDKASAMAKGVQIVGPTGTLLGLLRAIDASSLIERMRSLSPKATTTDELVGWMRKGQDLLKGIIGDEAESIRILDLTSGYPEPVLKVDHWARTVALACRESVSDDMSLEKRTVRKALADRFESAANEFLAKSASAADDDDDDRPTKDDLEKAEQERDEALGKLDTFNAQLLPMVKSAQERQTELKKAQSRIGELEAEVKKLQEQPMPSKGRVGEAGDLTKADKSADTGTNTAQILLDKAIKLPPGAGNRGDALLQAAMRMRAEEDGAAAA